jgi:hypothetical protein
MITEASSLCRRSQAPDALPGDPWSASRFPFAHHARGSAFASRSRADSGPDPAGPRRTGPSSRGRPLRGRHPGPCCHRVTRPIPSDFGHRLGRRRPRSDPSCRSLDRRSHRHGRHPTPGVPCHRRGSHRCRFHYRYHPHSPHRRRPPWRGRPRPWGTAGGGLPDTGRQTSQGSPSPGTGRVESSLVSSFVTVVFTTDQTVTTRWLPGSQGGGKRSARRMTGRASGSDATASRVAPHDQPRHSSKGELIRWFSWRAPAAPERGLCALGSCPARGFARRSAR